MSEYKSSEYVLGVIFGLLSPITIPKYLKNKPTNVSPDEYIVINTLGVDANIMQKCRVNVNYHVKDINAGVSIGYVPDDYKLNIGINAVKAILEKISTTSYLIDFEGEEIFYEEVLNEHYSNLKFSFKIINN
jgi:hypothetical protein